MANIQARKNKDGKVISYRIKVYKFTDDFGKKHFWEETYKINPAWSELKNKKEAEKFATLFEQECKNGLACDNKQTFKKYSEHVLELKENRGVKHSTIQLYKRLLENINTAIGHIKIADLKPQHLSQFYIKLSKDGLNKSTGGKLSNKTITEHHRLIHTILEQAVKELLVPYNIADRVEPPKVKRKEAKHYELEDVIKILELSKQEPLKWQALINMFIYTGCRRGEVLGLKWNKIDFDKNLIKIDNNILYSTERGVYSDTPKTEQSIRTISIPNEVIELLKTYRHEQRKKRLEYGSKWNNTGYVFTQENGEPMHPDTPTNYFKKFTLKYNKLLTKEGKELLPSLNPHAFRHTQASLLMACSDKNAIIEISKRLGHSKVSTTSDIYSHILKGKDEELSNSLSNMISGYNNSLDKFA